MDKVTQSVGTLPPYLRSKQIMLRKKWLIVAVVLICAVVSDMELQRMFGLGNPVTASSDDTCGYILTPNQHKLRFGHHVDINRFAMRSAPISARKVPGRTRLFFVGDSILYGTSRVGKDIFNATILNRELPQITHHPVEVLNASASGWAIANETDYIKSRGIFGSDLVLLVLNSGDLSQSRSDASGLGSDLLPNHPYACAWCEVWGRLLKPKILHIASREDAGTTIKFDPIQIENNLRSLDEFRSIVASHRSPMAIIFVAFRKTISDTSEHSAPGQLTNWATRFRVPLLDLTPFEAPYPTRELTLDGVHLNAMGNRVVATAIEENWRVLDPLGA